MERARKSQADSVIFPKMRKRVDYGKKVLQKLFNIPKLNS